MSFFANSPLSSAIEAATAKAEADGTTVILETTWADAQGLTRTDRVQPENLAAAVHARACGDGTIEVHLLGKNDRGCAWAECGPDGWVWNGERGSSVVNRFLANVLA